MTLSSIMALVHCNGQILTDELDSTIFVNQITASVEVYESMPLSVLKQALYICLSQMMASHTLLVYVISVQCI